MDRIYGGDMKKWETFCKALKARLYLRKLPNWENTPKVCQDIITMVDDVLPTWEEPIYNYPGGVTESNCPWGPYAPKINSWESRDNRLDESIPTTFFLHGILGGYDFPNNKKFDPRGYALDPRADKIMEPREKEKNNQLRHLESNIGMDIDYTIINYPNLLAPTNPYTQNTGYIALITEEELMFIKAEAQYWAGKISEAYETTKKATIFNMARYGINEADLTGNALKRYQRFFNIKLPGAAQFTIADLMQQKYVAMYLQPEQWTDLRRYNYSSTNNGISYIHPTTSTPVYVYDVKNVHNGTLVNKFEADSVNFDKTYSLRRPYNLYEAYWCTPDDFANGKDGRLSPNAWVNRLNADTETETKYNKKELDRLGYYTTNAAGEKVLDYRILKKRMIWAHKYNGPAHSMDPQIPWM
jgi:hypothetical protein